MIETFLSIFPMDQIEFAALMIHMTCLTTIESRLSVETFAQFDPIRQQGMARQTFIAKIPSADIVALSAIGKPFQIGVNRMKVARR